LSVMVLESVDKQGKYCSDASHYGRKTDGERPCLPRPAPAPLNLRKVIGQYSRFCCDVR
jgi:hypothetical protein